MRRITVIWLLLLPVLVNAQKLKQRLWEADAIVKSMLEHSRISKGEKQPTDINALAEEYLRLAYHRFKAIIETHFEEGISKLNIVPQDIGRVFLNLYNNAFYSVNEKKQRIDDGYEPIVSVSAKRSNNKVEIAVGDNGTGISQQVLDKIYQPFFTTKPTGQSTGLGLSLNYDIITKVHGGELKVDSKEGEYIAFSILISGG